jgi:DNA-binding response OmpR family regulator
MTTPSHPVVFILLIEDEDGWAGVFERALGRRGYATFRCATSEHALAVLRQRRFDLVLLDLCLGHPDMSLETDELLAGIRQIAPETPIIAATAKNVRLDKVFRLHNQGVVDFFSKLYGTLEELEEKVRAALAGDRPDAATPTQTKQQVPTLHRSREIAYRLYEWAVSIKPDLADVTDEEVYDWLVERQRVEGEVPIELPPKKESWTRYLREARAAYDTSKHNHRGGRGHGGSIVGPDQV